MYLERALLLIKPDGIQRGLVGEIIKRFEQRGYRLAAIKMAKVYSIFLFIFILHLIFYPFLIINSII